MIRYSTGKKSSKDKKKLEKAMKVLKVFNSFLKVLCSSYFFVLFMCIMSHVVKTKAKIFCLYFVFPETQKEEKGRGL